MRNSQAWFTLALSRRTAAMQLSKSKLQIVPRMQQLVIKVIEPKSLRRR
jgi:hypothetical protein